MRYRHRLWLANEDLYQTENLNEFSKPIENAVAKFNVVSARSRNPKKIVSYSISERAIELISESTEPLERPNLALQVFSSYLAKEGMGCCVKNKALFRGEAQELDAGNNKGDVSDEALLLEIFRIFLRNTKENRKKINRIKTIVLDIDEGNTADER